MRPTAQRNGDGQQRCTSGVLLAHAAQLLIGAETIESQVSPLFTSENGIGLG